ncbi:hypothetical protein [Synechococcus sp. WH 8020]|uniref:hypothetical protein n=1 Tax=Synechococcus sp. (strain WH8020) TaxID=32052 RepID=UPI0012ED3345|nr:hypothetical protein [Synechococcus sp. WH 8020]
MAGLSADHTAAFIPTSTHLRPSSLAHGLRLFPEHIQGVLTISVEGDPMASAAAVSVVRTMCSPRLTFSGQCCGGCRWPEWRHRPVVQVLRHARVASLCH